MTIKNLFSKLLVVAMIFATCATITSCQKDVVDNPQPEQPESKYTPGDDFYRYANAEKFKALEGANPNDSFSWFLDIDKYNDPRIEAVENNMAEYQAIKKALSRLEEMEDTSAALINQLVNLLTQNIKTKEDAYLAYGKAIKLGISKLGEVFIALDYDNKTIGYRVVPILGLASLETADASLSNVESQDACLGNHNIVNVKHLHRYVPGTRSNSEMIERIIEGIGLDPNYYLHDPMFDAGFEALENFTLEEWIAAITEVTSYSLLMYCVDESAKELSDGEYSSVSDYLDKTLDYDLGYIKAYHYCNTYPTTESKEAIANMGSEIISTFRTRIENSSWLSGATIAAAIDKLDNMGMNYGEPIEWPYTESLEFGDEEILVDYILTIKTLRNKVIGSILGKHYADYVSIIAMYSDTQPLFPFSVNAFYMPSVNAFNILPSLMMEPAYNANAEEAELYATLGFTIGHEITHGYDKGGSTYDKYGNVSNWWTDEDLAKFTALNERRIANVATFEVIPGYLAKAEATVREDVADLGGFAITYNLWCDILEERGLQGEELNEQKRAFFLKYASLFFEKHPESYMIKRLNDDTHSAGHIRINSVVQHIDDWYELFDVKEGDALYLAPEDRIVIW